MIRPRMFHTLSSGLLLGLALAPLVWFSTASISAQSLPFTPTPEPTEQPPATSTPAPTQTPLVLVATPTPQPATPAPTATPLPPGFGRDACDPNHSLQQPCALPTEVEVDNLSFTDGATDVFSFLLKGGRQYRIAASIAPPGGLDPALELFLAGAADRPLASNDDERIGSPSAAITITVQADGWYLARITNQAPGDPRGKVYSMSARSVAPAGGLTPATPSHPDDLVGNAYDVAHAVRLAWNVPYDLTMQCPDPTPGACYAGRHTFLLLPVKVGVPLSVLTYDLGAGVDTVLTLYKPDISQTLAAPGVLPGWRAVAANDDIAPGWTLRSQLALTPDWPGLALLVVAPSERADLPPIPSDGRPGRYRLIVGSPELPNLKAVLAAQRDLPPEAAPPTARPTGQAAPAAIGADPAQDTREVIREACSIGMAAVGQRPSSLFAAAPPGSDDRIAEYPPGALVRLLGQCYRGWVKVQPVDSVTPGWMWGAHLRPEALEPTPPAALQPGASARPAAQLPGAPTHQAGSAQPTAPALALPVAVTMTQLTPEPLPSAAPPRPAARQVTVEICRAPRQGDGCAQPLAGVRVDLLLAATRQVLTSNLTAADGRVTLSVSVPVGGQVLLQIPALGLELPLAPEVTALPVRLPEEP